MCIHAGALDLLQWVVESKVQNAFEIGFEIKENWEMKEFKKIINFIFESLLKFFIFIWVEKNIWINI